MAEMEQGRRGAKDLQVTGGLLLGCVALLLGLLSSGPVTTAFAGSTAASDLMPPRGLIPRGFTLDESQTRLIGQVFVEQVYIGASGTSWAVSATVLPTSEAAWHAFMDRQRALGQADVLVERLSGFGEEVVTMTERVANPLIVARTYAKVGRTVLGVVETARPGTLDPVQRMRILQWMVGQAKRIGV